MAGVRDRWRRPLLDLPRTTTRAACAALGLVVWDDPHNDDPRHARVRARAALALLEGDLGPGLVAGLARSAALARDDADALDQLAQQAYDELADLEVAALAGLAPAVRRRVLRLAVGAASAGKCALTSNQLAAVDALVTDWRGQGAVALPTGLTAVRAGGRLLVRH